MQQRLRYGANTEHRTVAVMTCGINEYVESHSTQKIASINWFATV